MMLNEERDIILNALHYHFGKHRISYDRLRDYLMNNTAIEHRRIDTVTEDLVSQGYIGKVMDNQFHDFEISPQGESILEEFGGFVGKKRKENQPPSPSVQIITGGGNIVGSQ